MKHLLITTIAAVLLVGCGEAQQSAPPAEAKPVEPVAKAPDISIHKAAYDGNIEAVKQHLAAGADVNAKDKKRWTPLHRAVQKGHKKIVELLIANGSDVNAKNQNRYTPLHKAVDDGHKEIVELLITEGADVNAKEGGGGAPLHHAVLFAGDKELAELLIAKGADVNAMDKDGNTPLDYADGEIAALLRKHGGKMGEELENAEPVAEAAKVEPPTAKAPVISIHDAALEGNIEVVKQHLAAGADVNTKHKPYGTPLHSAANKEIAELLIANGADVNAKDIYDRTPLHAVAEEGHKAVADLLIAKGADVNAKDVDGWTPLHIATREVAESLTVNGADVNAKGFGGTPLDRAIKYNHTETADLLRKHGGKTGAELKAEGK
jgi:cytohesin